MKKNLMSLAVAASVAGATTAQAAMYLDHEGTGEVLLFPYFTAVGTNESSFHIVNTTDEAKAVKVRILEYINSQEVLDFNLYLSAKDHFSFTIFQHPDANNGALVTRDNSCTVPALGTATGLGEPYEGFTTDSGAKIQPFLPYQYQADYDGLDFQARSQVGHIEVIEMGELFDPDTTFTPATWATHDSTGVPASCAKLAEAWDPNKGTWGKKNGTPSLGITVAGGGLYGLSNILDSQDAAAFGVEPAAIDDFWGTGGVAGGKSHTDPGNILPSLGEGDTVSLINAEGASFKLTYDDSWDAVSSLFMSDELYNDVMINPNLGGMTDWIVSFPTKKNYVNGTTPVKPFGEIFATGTKTTPLKYAYANLACEPMEITQWNREESTPEITGKPVFSPKPPGQEAATYKMCLETNTLAMGAAGTASVFGTPLAVTDEEYKPASNLSFITGDTEGWMRMGFKADHQYLDADKSERAGGYSGLDSTTNARLLGLPAMGFAAFKYANGDRSYGFVSEHKSQTAGSAIHS